MEFLPSEISALRREVAQLRAYEEIRNRIYACARALDRLDRALLMEQFWPDAETDYGVFYRGPVTGFVAVALQFQGTMRDTQHLVGNIGIRVEDAIAHAESYVHAHHTIVQGEDLVQLMVGGRYLDRLERRGEEWRISFRTELIDWGRWLPVPERWFESNHELPKGQRDRGDASYAFVGAEGRATSPGAGAPRR